MNILSLNFGSGSQKVSLFSSRQDRDEDGLDKEPIWEATIDRTAPGQPPGKLFVNLTVNGVSKRAEVAANSTIEQRLNFTFDLLVQSDTGVLHQISEIAAIAHRIVHGGSRYREAVEITEEVEEEIWLLAAFAPLHKPVQLEGVKAARKKVGPNVRQVAVFDTAFHQSLSPAAKTYPGPFGWVERGIIRTVSTVLALGTQRSRLTDILG